MNLKYLIFLTSLILFSFIVQLKSFAQSNNPSPLTFPTPKNIENMLFYLQRDPNINTAIYAINYDDNGVLDKKNPVKVYWIRYAEKGEKKDLNYIQRKFGYGVESKNIGNNEYEIHFVSYKKLPLTLSKSAIDHKYHTFANVNQKKIQIEKIFVRIEGGTFWLPNVRYVEVSGIDLSSNKPITERMILK
jgi:hypothetical protein